MSCVSRSGPIRELGGKAFALARLDAAELPIPWCAVTPAAFARSITAEQQEALHRARSSEYTTRWPALNPRPMLLPRFPRP